MIFSLIIKYLAQTAKDLDEKINTFSNSKVHEVNFIPWELL